MTTLNMRLAGPGTLASLISERIRHDISAAVFLPGQRLGIAHLRERYGVGASPIREALNRLSSEGVVSQADQRGFRVPGIDADDLHDLVLTRCMVNEMAVHAAVEHANESSDAAMVVAFHRLRRTFPGLASDDPELRSEWLEAHHEFHASLIACCGSRRLVDFDASLTFRTEQYIALSGLRDQPLTLGGPVRDIEGEHRRIMEAILDRDAERAVRLLNEHIRTTMTAVEEYVRSRPPLEGAGHKRVRSTRSA